jgi:signal transduction histidine kinase
MKLTQRLFLFLFLTLSSTGLSIYLLSNQIFLQGFEEIEDGLALGNLQRISNFIREEIEQLNSAAITWSSWDETYKFMQNRDPKYLSSNYQTGSILEADFDQIVILDSKGQILMARTFSKSEKSFGKIEQGQMDLFEKKLIPFALKEGKSIKGLFVGSQSRPAFLTITPILPSDGKGESRGTFIVLRQIDEQLKERFSKILKLEMQLSIGRIDEWSDELHGSGILLKGPKGMQGIVGLADIFQQSNLIIRLESPRTIYNQGRKTILSFVMIVGFFLTMAFGLIFFGFHRDVLSKIMKLKNELNEIGGQTHQTQRVQWSGQDEIAELSQNINSMLTRLENSQVMASRTSKFTALGEMAGSIAHEINNPLAIITGFCTRLLRTAEKQDIDREEIKDTSNRILKTAYRIERIIKSLRLVSRDGERDTKSDVLLGDIMDEVISLSENKLQESQIELRMEHFDFNQKISVRFVQIVQVLLNLLANSLDAISNLPEKWVEIRSESDGETIHLFFTDSGSGIPAEIADKVMDPFFTTKEAGHGTGLGLSITKGIIESHQGQFTLVKNSTHTCFRISLPIH